MHNTCWIRRNHCTLFIPIPFYDSQHWKCNSLTCAYVYHRSHQRREQERRIHRANLSVGIDATKMTMSLRPRDDNRSEKGRKCHSTTRPRSIHHNSYSRYRSFSFSGGSDDDNDNDTGMSDEENMTDINDDISKNSHSGGSGNDDDFTFTRVDKEKGNSSNDNSIKENSFPSDAAQLTDLQRMRTNLTFSLSTIQYKIESECYFTIHRWFDYGFLCCIIGLISEAIILNGGSCHLDVIHDYVLKVMSHKRIHTTRRRSCHI
jgi:hypothetical protein